MECVQKWVLSFSGTKYFQISLRLQWLHSLNIILLKHGIFGKQILPRQENLLDHVI